MTALSCSTSCENKAMHTMRAPASPCCGRMSAPTAQQAVQHKAGRMPSPFMLPCCARLRRLTPPGPRQASGEASRASSDSGRSDGPTAAAAAKAPKSAWSRPDGQVRRARGSAKGGLLLRVWVAAGYLLMPMCTLRGGCDADPCAPPGDGGASRCTAPAATAECQWVPAGAVHTEGRACCGQRAAGDQRSCGKEPGGRVLPQPY